MASFVAWLKRIKSRCPQCPACKERDWPQLSFDSVFVLVNPRTPIGHPELQGGLDGMPVFPVTCKHCGYVATYSVQHLENASVWEY